MNYEKYLTVTVSVGTLNNFIWDGNGNFTAAGNSYRKSRVVLNKQSTLQPVSYQLIK